MAVHASGVLIASGTSVANGGVANSPVISNDAGLGAIVTGYINNGATPPTAGAVATLYVSGDNVSFDEWERETAGIAANSSYLIRFTVPPEARYFNVSVFGNTGAAVTAKASYQQLLSV